MKSKYPDIKRFLDHPFWLPTLDDGVTYERTQDDQQESAAGQLRLRFGPDGDAYIGIDEKELIHFRNYTGGGTSLRTHAALMVLAEAIRLDNLEHAQARPAATLASTPPLAGRPLALCC
jgi:hypothetical protein